ncbi:MAG TPA: MarC family protein [archaeon]|nr:MarC family protein [archaeon]
MVVDAISTIVTLFAIIEPFGAIPIFLIMFGKAKKPMQRKAALEISIAALVLLLIFAAGGVALLNILGISIPAFMIAGGILLLALSFDFIKGGPAKSRNFELKASDAIVPIGTPMLAGPGAITTSIYLSEQVGFLVVAASLVAVFVICFLFLYGGRLISRVLGSSGLKILTRIMGLITAAVAISLIEKALVAYGVLQPLV